SAGSARDRSTGSLPHPSAHSAPHRSTGSVLPRSARSVLHWSTGFAPPGPIGSFATSVDWTHDASVRSRAATSALLRSFFVVERYLAADHPLECCRSHFSRRDFAGALGPFIQPASLACGNDRQLVFVL